MPSISSHETVRSHLSLFHQGSLSANSELVPNLDFFLNQFVTESDEPLNHSSEQYTAIQNSVVQSLSGAQLKSHCVGHSAAQHYVAIVAPQHGRKGSITKLEANNLLGILKRLSKQHQKWYCTLLGS